MAELTPDELAGLETSGGVDFVYGRLEREAPEPQMAARLRFLRPDRRRDVGRSSRLGPHLFEAQAGALL
jgi:hypothetical protein